MIRKCANPDCDTKFHYSTRGRLFPYEVKRPAEPCRDLSAVICDKKPERATVYFWLCSRCCRRFTLEFSIPEGLVLIPLDAGGDLHVEESNSRDRDYVSRWHVRTHEHTNAAAMD
jgi:hypothetical protein